jgi:lipoyl-dependent peroxiredoxin
MKKTASAVWKGGLKDGKGTISTESGVLSNAPYGFQARFEGGKGTNPEELLGAAHAGCFSMALSAQLGEAKLVAESIRTTATVTLNLENRCQTPISKNQGQTTFFEASRR